MRRIPVFARSSSRCSSPRASGGGTCLHRDDCAAGGFGGGARGGDSGAAVASVVIDGVNAGNGRVVITPVPQVSPNLTG